MPGGSPFTIHSCYNPSSGESLFFGSHSRHLPMKLTNEGSGLSYLSLFMMYLNLSSFCSLVSTSSGAGTALSLNWENNCFLYEQFKTYFEGMPITSMISWSCSFSFVPGNNGKPVYNSIMMQPKLHISIC